MDPQRFAERSVLIAALTYGKANYLFFVGWRAACAQRTLGEISQGPHIVCLR